VDEDEWQLTQQTTKKIEVELVDTSFLGMGLRSHIVVTFNPLGEVLRYHVFLRRATTWNPIDKSLAVLEYPNTGDSVAIETYVRSLITKLPP